METNIKKIASIIDYIDEHLEEKLDLDMIAKEAGYSKYHLHRMFTGIVGFSLHTYVQRRRLTEAARLLVFTDRPVMDIALFAGYETQQSFTTGFKNLFKMSPKAFRKRRSFMPYQLKFNADGMTKLRGDKMMDIKIVEHGKILLMGYKANTKKGFAVIAKCWKKMQANENSIQNRSASDFLVGLNDYTQTFSYESTQPVFDYYAAVEVSLFENIPNGMETKVLPAGRYAVFSFAGKNQDSLQPVTDYIYKEWFPHSTCKLNENAEYDFAKYGEHVDQNGNSNIEYWVPIL